MNKIKEDLNKIICFFFSYMTKNYSSIHTFTYLISYIYTFDPHHIIALVF